LSVFCREEWEWLHKNHDESLTDDECSDNSLQSFKTQFRNGAKELFDMLSKILKIDKGY
jgi:hypothetical protein